MEPSAIGRLGALLDAALALPPDRRAAFARESCVDDAERASLVELIEAHDRAADWFDGLAAELAGNADLEIDVAGARGSLVGHWRIVRLLGRGGMGAVYLVERA